MDFEKRAKEIISKIPYITIASLSKEGEPWNTPVFSAHDENYNFYWGSYRESQHAKNIRINPNVFLVIYDSTVLPGTGEGVYIKAVSEELEDPKEIEIVHRLLKDRHVVPYWKIGEVKGDSPIRLYKARPNKVWMNSEGSVNGHYVDTRVEINTKQWCN